MVEENLTESKPATVSQAPESGSIPFGSAPFVPGQETRVAMDLAGIRDVRRRQTILTVVVVAIAVVALVALIYAIV